MYSNDLDSVTNNLRDSANGTFVTFDDFSHLTNIGDGTLPPQSIPGGTGTRPKASGAHEKSNQFF